MATYALNVREGNCQFGIVATFDDGSTVSIVSRGTDRDEFGTRQRYAYTVCQPTVPRTVANGEDLRSAVGEGVNYLKIMDAWVSFALADSERYQADMTGSAIEEWCYMHDDELQMLSLDLKEGGNVLFG